MKKLLVVFLALTLFGVFAFAQDAEAAAPVLTFSGSVKTGVIVNGSDAGDPTVKLYESDDPQPGAIWFDGTINGTMAGGKFELYSTTYDVTAVKSDALYGWWKPIDMLTLTVGQGYDLAYETPYEGWDNGNIGAQLKLIPIEGLVFAVDLPLAKTGAAAAFTYPIVMAAYTAAGIAKVGVNADFANKVYIAGLDIIAVPNLTAQFDFRYKDAGSAYDAEEYFAYAIGAIKPYLWLAESNVKGAAAVIAVPYAVNPLTGEITGVTGAVAGTDSEKWIVEPGVEYTMGTVTPGAYFKYCESGDWSVRAYATTTVDKNNIKFYADYNKDKTWDAAIRYIVKF
jgi:hypothetical protein